MIRRERKNRSGLYIAVFIAAVMIFSTIGFIFGERADTTANYKYGEYKFSATSDNKWATDYNGKSLKFSYLPEEIVDVKIPENAASLLKNSKMAYVTYDPEQIGSQEAALAQYELAVLLWNAKIYVQNGMTKENNYNISVITCANATAAVPVIDIERTSDNSTVEFDNNCILLKGNPTLLKDRVAYTALGIIK